jgi:hypothetical protein
MLLDLTYRYQATQPQNIYFFILCNVGELGDIFILAPRGIDLVGLQEKLLSNQAPHADNPGHQYCRIARISNARLCWTFNHITRTGRSIGRRGIVYTFGCVFDPALLRAYNGVLFNLFYSFMHQVHAAQNPSGRVEEAIEDIVRALNDPNARSTRTKLLKYIHAVQTQVLLFEAGLQSPTKWQRANARARAILATITGYKAKPLLPVAALGNLNTEDVMWIFNTHLSRTAPTCFPARSAVTTWQEFASDTNIQVVQIPQMDYRHITTRLGVLPTGRYFLTIHHYPPFMDIRSYLQRARRAIRARLPMKRFAQRD